MNSAGSESATKPHAVCVPFPAQSHIGAMLKLAKLLHHKGFHISFVNTEYNHRRLAGARGLDFANGTLSDFQFLTIPDGLPPSDADATQDLPTLCNATRNYMAGPFGDLVSSLGLKPSLPCMTFPTSPAASRYGIPLIHLFTTSGSAILPMKQLRALRENGSDDPLFNFSTDVLDRTSNAVATIVHTFEALERDVLCALSSMIPRVYAVGPLHLMIDRIARDESFVTKHIECNLLEEHNECLQWLDSKEPNSVIYVNFGSIAFVTHQ